MLNLKLGKWKTMTYQVLLACHNWPEWALTGPILPASGPILVSYGISTALVRPRVFVICSPATDTAALPIQQPLTVGLSVDATDHLGLAPIDKFPATVSLKFP